VRFLRLLVRSVFWLAAAGFFALFILEFARSAALDSSALVVLLRRLGNPIVRQVGSWLGIGAGTGLAKYLPLAVALATLGIQVAIDTVLLKISIAMALRRSGGRRRLPRLRRPRHRRTSPKRCTCLRPTLACGHRDVASIAAIQPGASAASSVAVTRGGRAGAQRARAARLPRAFHHGGRAGD
jgi:hypothetical protein